MSRPMTLLVAILAIAGCKGPGTPTDPFFGRTRVEPPRTGTISRQGAPIAGAQGPSATGNTPGSFGGQTGVPSSGASSSSIFPPSQVSGGQSNWTAPGPKVNPVPAAIAPQSNSGYRPPDGSFGFPSTSTAPKSENTLAGTGDRISIPVTATVQGPSASNFATRNNTAAGTNAWAGGSGQSATPSSAGLGATASGPMGTSPPSAGPSNPYLDSAPATTLVGREGIVRVIEPRQGTSVNVPPSSNPPASPANSGGGSASAPTSPPASDKPVNIADLPEARP